MYQKLDILDNKEFQNNLKIFLSTIIYFYLIKTLNLNYFYNLIFLDLFLIAIIILNKLNKISNIAVGLILAFVLLNNIYNLFYLICLILIKTKLLLLTIKVFINHKTIHLYSLNIIILLITGKYYSKAFQEYFENTGLPKKKYLSKRQSLGNARFMTIGEIRMLTHGKGLIMGKIPKRFSLKDEIIRIPIEGHGLTIAPPRSGKFVSCISPNLAATKDIGWHGPVVSIGPKGEEYSVWARHREQMGHKVILIDPFKVVKNLGINANLDYLTNAKTYNFNPLDFIRDGSEMVRDIGALMDALIEPSSSATSDNAEHFQLGARRIISGFIAWVLATEPKCNQNLIKVKELFNQPEEDLLELLQSMSNADYEFGFGLPQDAANLLLNIDSRERGSFFSTVTNALNYLKYPEMMSHLKTSDFNIEDLLDGKTDLFIVIPGNLTTDLKPWARLWVTLPIELLYRKRPKERILMMIDEMASLGKITQIKKAFNLNAGYGVSIWGFTQNIKDLYEVYGQYAADAMLGMAEFVQFFNVGASDLFTQNYLSDVFGSTTVLTKSNTSKKFSLNANFKERESVNYSESNCKLISSSEIINLSNNIVLILNKLKFKLLLQKQTCRKDFYNPYHFL
tara:strand:- start:12571 stop:14439 length:1869 start_codon:yes stop_codon:yes gene_type:complete